MMYNAKRYKGNSLLYFPGNYVVIDLETTGLDPKYNEIIEISAIKVVCFKIIDTFTTLIKPINEIDDFITQLTGITNDMVKNAPGIESVLHDFLKFVNREIVVGHNVNFDINFIYDYNNLFYNDHFNNDFVDTMRIARKLYPQLQHHKLIDIVEYLNIDTDTFHRSLSDCKSTYECFEAMRAEAALQYPNINDFYKTNYQYKKHIDVRTIKTENTEFDLTHPLYGKVCVFTGELERMTRTEAFQYIIDYGGSCGNDVTKSTNILIISNNEYCILLDDNKSNKHKKAEKLKLQGHDIEIISENVFYDLLDDQQNIESCVIDINYIENYMLSLFEQEKLNSFYMRKELRENVNDPENIKTIGYSYFMFGFKSFEYKFGKDYILVYETALSADIINSFNNYYRNSEKQNYYIRLIINDNTRLESIDTLISALYKYSKNNVKPDHDCCHQYMECSDARHCITQNKELSILCSYRKKLDKGIIFFGANRNV